MRIVYCDDEKTQYVYIKTLVEQWEREGNPHCDIIVYSSAEELLFENPDSFPYDFIILDIEMNGMNGLELARNIRKYDKNIMIAFLSNSREYVFDGYEVQAVRYLVKPLTREQLFPLLAMALKAAVTDKQYIIVGGATDKCKLCVEDICYVEAQGHYIVIHTDKSTFEVKRNINDIVDELGSGFISTHRSFLVNLNYIERITKTDCIMKGNVFIPISRNSYKAVNQAFIEYYKGGAF